MTSSACPKCTRARIPDSESCPRCGLVFALWSPDSAGPELVLPAEGETFWAAVVKAWDDDGAHDAFVKYCSAAGQLVVAGRRYRERLDTRQDDAVAARMQQRVVGMATAALKVQATVVRPPVTRSRWFWVIIIVCVIGGALAGLVFSRSGGVGR